MQGGYDNQKNEDNYLPLFIGVSQIFLSFRNLTAALMMKVIGRMNGAGKLFSRMVQTQAGGSVFLSNLV